MKFLWSMMEFYQFLEKDFSTLIGFFIILHVFELIMKKIYKVILAFVWLIECSASSTISPKYIPVFRSPPSARAEPILSYSSQTNQLVLFGGYSYDGFENDICTFSLKSNHWVSIFPMSTLSLGII